MQSIFAGSSIHGEAGEVGSAGCGLSVEPPRLKGALGDHTPLANIRTEWTVQE
jgi:hypothetical protein